MKQNRPNRSYRLVSYNDNWPKQFEKIANRVRSALGDEIIDIEHIGSTSIVGMAAKPQIDILVVVKDLEKIKEYYKVMDRSGFTPRGDYTGIGEEYFTEDNSQGIRLASIHILPIGHPEIKDQINFRDYLRVNHQDRSLYESTKEKLYRTHPGDYNLYDSGKEAVIREIKVRANEWAESARPNF